MAAATTTELRKRPASPMPLEEPAASKVKITPLTLTDEQRGAFQFIYTTLVPSNGSGGYHVVGALGLVGQRSALERMEEIVKDRVHPLAFLTFVEEDADLKDRLRVLCDKQGEWGMAKVGSVVAWAGRWFGGRAQEEAERVDQASQAPWVRTCADFSKNMVKHKEQGTLEIERFLAVIGESNRREQVTTYIASDKFT